MSNLTIVMYHYVRDLHHSSYPNIKGLEVSLFKEQLEYIRQHYKVIRMEELLASLQGGPSLPQNSLLLTFDDGYKDHFEYVFPILDELDMQGSFFLPGKAIQEHEVLDVNKIHFILAAVDDITLLIRDLYALMDIHRVEYNLDSNEDYFQRLALPGKFDTAKVIFVKKLLQKVLPPALRKIILNALFTKYVHQDEAIFSRELYMNIDQARCMLKHGMYIGSHGWEHYWLDTLSPDQQEHEIELGLKFLDNIGCDISKWVMCYPHGAYNDSLISLLKKHNCQLALGTEVGIVNLDTNNPFTFKRLNTNDLPKDRNAEPNEWTRQVIRD